MSLNESPHARGGSDERQRGAGAPPLHNTNALYENVNHKSINELG